MERQVTLRSRQCLRRLDFTLSIKQEMLYARKVQLDSSDIAILRLNEQADNWIVAINHVSARVYVLILE